MLMIAAATAAIDDDRTDYRENRLGAVGLRADGVIVCARNVPAHDVAPHHHAEARVARKLTPKSTVWVARIMRDGTWAMARPCSSCQIKLRSAGVKRVIYTISPNEWGTIDF